MKDLTQGSVTKHLLHMSAFLAASMLVQTLYLLADLYWVGHLSAVAASALSQFWQHVAAAVQLLDTADAFRDLGIALLTDARF